MSDVIDFGNQEFVHLGLGATVVFVAAGHGTEGRER